MRATSSIGAAVVADEGEGVVDPEEIDELGPAGGVARPDQALPVDENVDEG